MAWAPVEQAVTTAWLGPLSLWRIETWPDARLISRPGMKNGLIRRGPAVTQGQRGFVDAVDPADAGTDQHAGGAPIVLVLGMPVGVVQGLVGRGHRIDDEVVDLAGFLRLHPVVGIELAFGGRAARDLAGDLASEVINRKVGHPYRAALALEQIPPSGFHSATKRRDHPQTSDDNPSHMTIRPQLAGTKPASPL